MIISTTNEVVGMELVEHKGFVTGEVVAGINFLKDMGAGLRNIFGGRSQGYEQEIIKAREDVLEEMKEQAKNLGANAIVGVRFNIESMGANGGMLLVSVSGTAVVAR